MVMSLIHSKTYQGLRNRLSNSDSENVGPGFVVTGLIVDVGRKNAFDRRCPAYLFPISRLGTLPLLEPLCDLF